MTQINKYLTVIVRDDLSTGYKVPQSIHSVVEFSITHNDEYKNWKLHSNYLCCLEAPDYKIRDIIDLLELLKIKYSVFMEPDIGNEMTSITVEPLNSNLHKQLFNKLKLTNNGKN